MPEAINQHLWEQYTDARDALVNDMRKAKWTDEQIKGQINIGLQPAAAPVQQDPVEQVAEQPREPEQATGTTDEFTDFVEEITDGVCAEELDMSPAPHPPKVIIVRGESPPNDRQVEANMVFIRQDGVQTWPPTLGVRTIWTKKDDATWTRKRIVRHDRDTRQAA